MRADEIFAALAAGQHVWMKVHGASMRPVLRGAEELYVVRCSADILERGDIAVLRRSDGTLIAHLVIDTSPTVTSAFSGALDPPGLELLGRADAIRHGAIVVPVNELTRRSLHLAHRAWVRLHKAATPRGVVDWLASDTTAPARTLLLGNLEVGVADPSTADEVLRFSARFTTIAPDVLSSAVAAGQVSTARARGRLVAMAFQENTYVSRVARSLGLEQRLLAALPTRKRYRKPRLTDVPHVHSTTALEQVGGRWVAATEESVHTFLEEDGSVSEVAERIVGLIDGQRPIAEIARVIGEEFEVDRAECEQDTLRFIAELVDKRVVAL